MSTLRAGMECVAIIAGVVVLQLAILVFLMR